MKSPDFCAYRNKDNPLVYIRFCNSCTPILYFHIEFISQTVMVISKLRVIRQPQDIYLISNLCSDYIVFS